MSMTTALAGDWRSRSRASALTAGASGRKESLLASTPLLFAIVGA